METTSQQFIINKLNHLVDKLPYVFVRYENDSEGSHFVDIRSFQNNVFDDFIDKFTLLLLTDFVNFFPDQHIAFLGEESLYDIENATFYKKGELFELAKDINLVGQNFATTLQEITQNYIPQFPKEMNFSIRDNFGEFSEQYLSSIFLNDKDIAVSQSTNSFNSDEDYSFAA